MISTTNNQVRFLPLHFLNLTRSDLTLYCCSANEQEILKISGLASRLKVAKANLAIASWFVSEGHFGRGKVFVLTNPSELIAEYIARSSNNLEVYALGLSNDSRRYMKIFRALGLPKDSCSQFTISGNHWDHPVPIFDPHSRLPQQLRSVFPKTLAVNDEQLLEVLHAMLKKEIAREFLGFRPPIESGSMVLKDLLGAMESSGNVVASGMAHDKRNFVAGMLSFDSSSNVIFKPSPRGNAANILRRIYEKHQLAYNNLIKRAPYLELRS